MQPNGQSVSSEAHILHPEGHLRCAQCALHVLLFLLFCISELDRHLSSKQINPVILRTHCWSPNWTQQRKESPSWKGLLKVLKHCPHIGAIAFSTMLWTTLDWQELHCVGAGKGTFGVSLASIWVETYSIQNKLFLALCPQENIEACWTFSSAVVLKQKMPILPYVALVWTFVSSWAIYSQIQRSS